MSEKTLYIISGCNGAGKTTASYTILPEIWQCKEFVNADEIARGLSPFNPESVAIEAGKLMLKRIEVLLRTDTTFSIETTLATKSYRNLIKRAQAKGYKVKLLFIWLDTSQSAIERVAQRVREGGHNIPSDVIIRRYHAGINNLFCLYTSCVDYWIIVNNTNGSCDYIAEGGKDINTEIFDLSTFYKILNYVRK